MRYSDLRHSEVLKNPTLGKKISRKVKIVSGRESFLKVDLR